MRSFFIFFLSIASLLIAVPAGHTPFKMLRANNVTGMIPDIKDAYGAAFQDINNDGYPDIYLVCFRTLNRLLINNGGLIPFVDRTVLAGTGGNLMSHGNKNLELGISIADYDNDGAKDMFLAGWGKSFRLFKNLGNVRFANKTSNLHALGTIDANIGLWLDANNDGYLDLYITDEHKSNRLFMNNKDGGFFEQSWSDQFIAPATSEGASAGDLDGDGDQDIYVSNWFAPDYLMINNGTGLFERRFPNLATLHDSSSTNSSTFADLDNDGDLDILVCGNDDRVYLYRNTQEGELRFEADSDIPFAHLDGRVFGIVAADFNQDGWLDCFITTTKLNYLYLNDGTGNFLDTYDSDNEIAYSTGAAVADLDNDGDLDLVVSNKNKISQLFLNPSNSQHYIKLVLQGVTSNRDAIGAHIFFYSNIDSAQSLLGLRVVESNSAYLSSRTTAVYYGCGTRKKIDIKIIFPSGNVKIVKNLLSGHSYSISETSSFYRSYIFAKRLIKDISEQPGFWMGVLFFLLTVGIIITYLVLGLRRYGWSNTTISTQLFMWFIISLLLFISLRSISTLALLKLLAGIVLLGSALSVFFSEHSLRLRRKKDRIRELLRLLSERIINIHDNKQLIDEVLSTILNHPDISLCGYYQLSTGGHATSTACSEKSYNLPKLHFTESELVEISKQKSLCGKDGIKGKTDNEDFGRLFIIKRAKTFIGFLFVRFRHPGKDLAGDDIAQLETLAGQIAIAIENNNYIQETAQLIEELTRSKVQAEYVSELEKSNRLLDEKNRELNRLFRELQQKESQLIHSEKMASLGQLVAGISHELNNPISFIYANMKILNGYLGDLEELLKNMPRSPALKEVIFDIRETISDSTNGSKSVKEIVQNLKSFSRLDEANWKESDIREIIESCLKIIRMQLPTGVQITTDYMDDPRFMCNPGQLNQVFLNILTNAVQAVGESGTILINTKTNDDFLEVTISDDGPGIPKEVISRIFDPFFTTKPINSGTGLGLSITYSIIEKHHGTIKVASNQKDGTIFTVRIPLRSVKV